jgi:hypothetical protein
VPSSASFSANTWGTQTQDILLGAHKLPDKTWARIWNQGMDYVHDRHNHGDYAAQFVNRKRVGPSAYANIILDDEESD